MIGVGVRWEMGGCRRCEVFDGGMMRRTRNVGAACERMNEGRKEGKGWI